MDEKNEKAVKNRFPQPAGPMGRGAVWCGGGLRRLLNRIFLGEVKFGYKEKSTGPKWEPCLAFLPNFFCGRNHLVA